MMYASGRCAAVGIRSRDEHGDLAVRFDLHDLVVHRVAAGPAHANARGHLAVLLDEVHAARLHQRHEVLREVARPVPFVRVRRVVVLAAPHGIPRPGESRHGPAVGATTREAAGMIEVQVRGDHQIDVVRRESAIGQRRDRGAAADRGCRCRRAWRPACRRPRRRSASTRARPRPATAAWPAGCDSGCRAARSAPRASSGRRRTWRRRRARSSRRGPDAVRAGRVAGPAAHARSPGTCARSASARRARRRPPRDG